MARGVACMIVGARLVELAAFAAVGGLLNRAHGGWLDLHSFPSGARHALLPLVFALPTGAMVR